MEESNDEPSEVIGDIIKPSWTDTFNHQRIYNQQKYIILWKCNQLHSQRVSSHQTIPSLDTINHQYVNSIYQKQATKSKKSKAKTKIIRRLRINRQEWI